MSDGDERLKGPHTGEDDVSEVSDTPGHTGQAEDHRIGTPPIGNDDQKAGQTQTPAADDDVGVPEHVEDRTD
jgi:hypothetical protein